MDAASNRSVDDVRELRERVGYAPGVGSWKVYILDEAHMLTKEAWNAFLKTLEEPPPNTVFVLATTEPQKVMATIVDRCQRFDFQRPSLEQIAEVIKRVADAEGIEVEDGAVALTARSASGSFRDALGTLDQLVAFGGERVATDDVVEVLGAADADLLFGVTDALAAGDSAAVLEVVDRLAQSGRDPGQFARDLIAHLRQLLVARATGAVPDSFTVTVAQPERLAEQAGAIGEAKLMGGIDALSVAVANMREGDDPRLSLEVALLKVARPSLDGSREALLRRIEQLERLMEGARGAPATSKAAPGAEGNARGAEGSATGRQGQSTSAQGESTSAQGKPAGIFETEPQQPPRRRRNRIPPQAKPRRWALMAKPSATNPAPTLKPSRRTTPPTSPASKTSGPQSSTTSATPVARSSPRSSRARGPFESAARRVRSTSASRRGPTSPSERRSRRPVRLSSPSRSRRSPA